MLTPQHMIEFNQKTQYYVVIPDKLHIYAQDGITLLERNTFIQTNCYIDGYKAFQYYIDVYEVKGIIIK